MKVTFLYYTLRSRAQSVLAFCYFNDALG